MECNAKDSAFQLLQRPQKRQARDENRQVLVGIWANLTVSTWSLPRATATTLCINVWEAVEDFSLEIFLTCSIYFHMNIFPAIRLKKWQCEAPIKKGLALDRRCRRREELAFKTSFTRGCCIKRKLSQRNEVQTHSRDGVCGIKKINTLMEFMWCYRRERDFTQYFFMLSFFIPSNQTWIRTAMEIHVKRCTASGKEFLREN